MDQALAQRRLGTMCATLEVETASEQETIEFGAVIGRVLKPGDLVLLLGELGSGKTRLAKGIVSAATGVSPHDVVSPTFTLINSFEGKFPVHHADLYRIEGDQVEGIGLDEALEDGAVVVEWAEKLQDMGYESLSIAIEVAGAENLRRIKLTWNENGSWDLRMREAAIKAEIEKRAERP
ncbi:MAG: tRNA (adenosine(37)-N6)-threonylcarbamoyltransferase complex ATPase subunit type 1 TsaE [Thermodesulfobacteriota bacterium]